MVTSYTFPSVLLLACAINILNSETENGIGVCAYRRASYKCEKEKEYTDKILQINFAWEGKEF
jgi:hypothetical protein